MAKRVIGAILSVILGLPVATTLHADCSVSINCGACNSGNFTATCMCKDIPGTWECKSCNPPPVCTGTGCCCGVYVQTNRSFCSAVSCSGSTGACSAELLPYKRLVASTSRQSIAAAMFAEKQGTQAPVQILNRDAPVEINTSGSGLDISNFDLEINDHEISGATFTVNNNSSKLLIAYVIGIDFYWGTSPSLPMHASVSEDSWFLNATPLQPGEKEPVRSMDSVIPQETVRLIRVEVNLEFAQFSDGGIVGRNAAALKLQFDKNRSSKLEVQYHYASMLKTGVSPENVALQVETDLKAGKYNESQRMALAQIGIELKNQGPSGLAKELLQEPKVPL